MLTVWRYVCLALAALPVVVIGGGGLVYSIWKHPIIILSVLFVIVMLITLFEWLFDYEFKKYLSHKR